MMCFPWVYFMLSIISLLTVTVHPAMWVLICMCQRNLMPQLLKEIQIVKSFNLISLEINLIHIPNLKIQLWIFLTDSKVPGYLKSCSSWTYMEELFECCATSLTVFRLVPYTEQDLSQVKIMVLLGDEMAGPCFWHDSCQIQLSERQQ